jgi:tRNA (adenine57-N1/adenine58-N1)-methyltransferase
MKSDAREGDSDAGNGGTFASSVIWRAYRPDGAGAVVRGVAGSVPHVPENLPVAGIAAGRRRGPFAVGELVQLSDPRGKMHTITLEAGKEFHTHRGRLPHDDLLGRPEGSVVTSSNGTAYLALRPILDDFVLAMPRGAQVIYPKDAARIVGLANLGPGARVAEAGVGSGAMTCSLIRAVADEGHVYSYERRADFAEIADGNVTRWFGCRPASWTLTVGDLVESLAETDLDAVVLDMLAPWECVDAVWNALAPGGVLVGYVATTTQLSRLVETLRVFGGWTEPRAEETLMRTWHLEGLAVRPDHRMNGHTGFLVTTRRLAAGTVLPPKRRRPSPGSYGSDYTGPGSADAAAEQADA